MILIPLVAALLAAPQFDVQTLDGGAASGAIVALDAEKVVIETAGGKRAFPLKDLLRAASKQPARTPAQPAILVELIDGSRFAATTFQSSKGVANITGGTSHSLDFPVKVVHSVRFFVPGESSEKMDRQWNEITSAQPTGDLLIIRKKGAIDSIDGVVGDVSTDGVAFTLDGDEIDVKRAKVEGILFAKTAGDELPEAVCALTDRKGSRLSAAVLTLENEGLEITTPAGVKTTLPLDDVAEFDFSSGKVLFLSDLEPESFTYQPYFASDQPLGALSDFYRLRRDVGLERNPLKLDGRTFRKGIALHSRSIVAYRLPRKFRLFKAVVGIDDAARDAGGDVMLEITGDGKSLWKGSVRGSEAAQALELDISGVRRLEIVADFGEGQDVADHLDLCDAAVTK